MGQSQSSKARMGRVIKAMPVANTQKQSISNLMSGDINNPEEVNRFAGEVFNQPVGQYDINKQKNTYTQKAAEGIELPKLPEEDEPRLLNQ